MSEDDYESSSFLMSNDNKLDYSSEISSFEFLPPSFNGINTKDFGVSKIKKGDLHPFFKLKNIALDKSINIDDRMQSVRYMIHIPYKNQTDHVVEAVKDILSDESVDIYKRYYFFNNNDKYFKLDDHVVKIIHPFFISLALKKKYPLELILLSARYIISFYEYSSKERYEALEYILDLADDENETLYARGEAADILLYAGEGDEILFGRKILESITEKGYSKESIKGIYTNIQNAHDQNINESVRNIVRRLHKEFSHIDFITETSNIETIQKLLTDKYKESTDTISHFFFRIMTDSSRYERLSLSDIFILVYLKIQTFEDGVKEECITRLVQEIIDSNETCSTGYLTRIVNVLTGFVKEDELRLKISVEDELRCATFARLNNSLKTLPGYLKEEVLHSLWESDDKQIFDEFYNMYSPEDELWGEYKKIISKEEFDKIYTKAVNDFKGERDDKGGNN